MQQFQVHPIQKTLPKGFRLSARCSRGHEQITCAFSAQYEFEIDAAITALIIFRSFLRENVTPLPKHLSLVPTHSAKEGE